MHIVKDSVDPKESQTVSASPSAVLHAWEIILLTVQSALYLYLVLQLLPAIIFS